MIDSQRIRAEVFRKSDSSFWVLASEANSIEGSITLESIGLTLSMRALYADTEDLLD